MPPVPSSLGIAGDKLARSPSYVGAVCVDMFDWLPPRRFDCVAFAAWLHHVPETYFNAFWRVVDAATTLDGRVLFDFAQESSTARIATPPARPSQKITAYNDLANGISVRDLEGQRWTVVYKIWNTGRLDERLRTLGWQLDVTGPGDGSFQWATARRRR